MQITEEMREALKEATKGWGGGAALAKKSGLTPAQLSKYSSGALDTWSLETWRKLRPYLEPHLPPEWLQGFDKQFPQFEVDAVLNAAPPSPPMVDPLTAHLLSKWAQLTSDKKRYQALEAVDKLINEESEK